tara:strand:+ start:1658 stop:3556 length:1899 start_codon:yes stop_codon:yes gene_type:complete
MALPTSALRRLQQQNNMGAIATPQLGGYKAPAQQSPVPQGAQSVMPDYGQGTPAMQAANQKQQAGQGQLMGGNDWRAGGMQSFYDPSSSDYDANRVAFNSMQPSSPYAEGGENYGKETYDPNRQYEGSEGHKAIQALQAQGQTWEQARQTYSQQLSQQNQQQPQAQQPYQPAPTGGSQNYGLAGAEAAYQGGLTGGINALQSGTQQGLNALENANAYGQGQIGQGTQNALGSLRQGMGASQGAVQQGVNALGGNFSGSASSVDSRTGLPMFQQAADTIGRYGDAGLQSQQQQLGLSGALGQEGFDAAFINNPGTKYLQDEMMRNTTNQASATGNVVSGNILRELQDRSAGIAAQDLDNQFNRAFQTTGQGMQAAGQQGNFLSQAGQQQGNLASQNAQMQTQASLQNANNRLGAAQSQANLFGQNANNLSNMFSQGATMQSNAGLNQANLAGQLGGQGASMMGNAGINAAYMFGQAGTSLGNARGQAGRDLAGSIAQSTGALSTLANQQGSGISDIIGQGGVNIGNLMSGSGNMSAQQQQQLAAMLANMSVGQGTQNSQAIGNAGQAQMGADLAQGQNMQNLLSNLAGAGGYYMGNQSPTGGMVPSSTGNGISTNQFINSQYAPNSGFTGFGG